jgi:hypothetical protein
MTPESNDNLRRLMGEASVLPPDDPLRREVENRITGDDNLAEPEWLALLQEAEMLRLELARISPPEHLTRRLLAIPDEQRHRIIPISRGTWLAAAIIVFLLVAGQTIRLNHQNLFRGRLETLATLALDDHLNDRLMSDTTNDFAALSENLARQLGFPVRLPELGDGFVLRGGRADKWASTHIALSQWEKGGEIFTLCQFCTHDRDLPSEVSQALFCCPEPGIDSIPTDIIVWADDDMGYVLVGPHKEIHDFEVGKNAMEAALAADQEMALNTIQSDKERG